MNKLTTIEQNSIGDLPQYMQPYVKAKFCPQIKDLVKNIELYEKVRIIVVNAFIALNSYELTDKRFVDATTNFFNEFINSSKCAVITLEEIQLAIKLGCSGEYGEPPKNISSSILIGWVRKFVESKNRIDALNAFNKKLEAGVTSNKPVVFTKEYLTKVANSALEDYKRDGTMPLIPHAIYDTIKEINGVETLILKEDWQRIKDEAKENYLLKMNPKKKKGIADMLDFGITYEFEVKKVALRYYFERSK